MRYLLLSVLVVCVIGVMVPGALAQVSTANLSVSFDGYGEQTFAMGSSLKVIEIIVDDPDISDTTVAQTEPIVMVNDDKRINMVQATDGKWYAYIADPEYIKWADSTVTTPGIGFDYGEFCSSGTDSSEFGMDLSGLSGVAIARPYVGTSSSTNGEATFQACSGGSVSSGPVLNNVVRNPPTLVSGAVPTGQIGIADNIFPVIQFLESYGDAYYIQYKDQELNTDSGNSPSIPDNANDGISSWIHMDHCNGQLDGIMGEDVCVTLYVSHLNIDPTSKDIWTFTLTNYYQGGIGEMYYRLFDSSSNADTTDILAEGPYSNLGFQYSPHIKIKGISTDGCHLDSDLEEYWASVKCLQPKSNQFQTLNANGSSPLLSSQQFITVIETEKNSSVFTTQDSNGVSSISSEILSGPENQIQLFSNYRGAHSGMLQLYQKTPTMEPQTITIQEDTIGVIPLEFDNNILFRQTYGLLGSDSHAAHLEFHDDADNFISPYSNWAEFYTQIGCLGWGNTGIPMTACYDPAGQPEGYEVFERGTPSYSNSEQWQELNFESNTDGIDISNYDLIYFPAEDFVGTDEFSFYLSSMYQPSVRPPEPTTFTVNVTPVNDPPWALGKDSHWTEESWENKRGDASSIVQMQEDGPPLEIYLAGFDVDGDSLSFEIVSQPTHGTLTEGTPYPSDQHDHCEYESEWSSQQGQYVSAAGTCPHPPWHQTKSYLYTPDANYFNAIGQGGGFTYTENPDSFTYKVNDGTLDSASFGDSVFGNTPANPTVEIRIIAVNDIPITDAGVDQSVEPGSIVQLDGSQSSDVDGDNVTYSWIQTSGNPVTLTSANIASPQFTAPSQNGQLTFMLTLNDSIATSNPDVVNIYVGESIPEPTSPPAPGSVASSASDSQVTLTWSPPSDDGGSVITDYLVEYATADGGTWLAYNDGTSTATSATITGLSNGQEYNFRISAVNSEGIGDASGSVDATPSVEPEVEPEEPEVEPVEPEVEPVEPEIIPEEPEPVMEIGPDAEPEMTSEAVPAFEPEPKSEASQSSAGCGAGTVMVNGVCQVAKTSGTSMAIEPMYIVIAAVAVGGVAVGALFALKRGSGTPKPAREGLEEYESKYVARKPAEKKETSSSCSNCGTSLKPTAKFCGSCGTPVS